MANSLNVEAPFPTSHRGTYFVGRVFLKPELCDVCYESSSCEIVAGDEDVMTGRVTPSKEVYLPCVKTEILTIVGRKKD